VIQTKTPHDKTHLVYLVAVMVIVCGRYGCGRYGVGQAAAFALFRRKMHSQDLMMSVAHQVPMSMTNAIVIHITRKVSTKLPVIFYFDIDL